MSNPPTSVFGPLVDRRRLGAALQSARAASGATMTELSRHSGHWWLPDELVQVERGTIELHDAEIITLARLYGVRPATAPVGAAGTLVVDRIPHRSAADAPGTTRPDAIAERLGALGRLLRLDDEVIMSWVPELADVIGVATLTMSREIERSLTDAPAIRQLADVLADRVIVPSTGVLIAEVPDAALLVGRRRDVPGAIGVLAAGTLTALTAEGARWAPLRS